MCVCPLCIYKIKPFLNGTFKKNNVFFGDIKHTQNKYYFSHCIHEERERDCLRCVHDDIAHVCQRLNRANYAKKKTSNLIKVESCVLLLYVCTFDMVTLRQVYIACYWIERFFLRNTNKIIMGL